MFGCPSYFTDGGDILNDSILYSFIAVLLLLYSVKFETYLINTNRSG